MKKILFLIILCTILAGAFSYKILTHKPEVEESGEETVLTDNTGTKEILDELEEKGYVQGTLQKKLLLALSTVYLRIQAGAYKLEKGMSPWEVYQQLANPYMRYITVVEGMRKEEIADKVGKTLGWSEEEKNKFLSTNKKLTVEHTIRDGFFYPTTYLLPVDGTGEEVAKKMTDEFNKKVIEKYSKSTSNIRNIDTTLKIASIIQREAAGKHDMRLISGIIWNRIFQGMPLQVDATVQYAKGNEKNWWPIVKVKDLTGIESPYNTYLNNGLPPSPISNPGPAAVEAAFNPQKTDCLYYFHDSNRKIYCSVTGEEHIRKVNQYLK